MDGRTLHARYIGAWCDNCRTALPFIPADGMCPDCKTVQVRKATITVDVHDQPARRYSEDT